METHLSLSHTIKLGPHEMLILHSPMGNTRLKEGTVVSPVVRISAATCTDISHTILPILSQQI